MIDVAAEKHTSTTAKTAIFVAIVVLGNTFGNLLLSVAMNQMPSFGSVAVLSYAADIVANPALLCGTGILIGSLFANLALFTWADLTYILPVTSSSYLLTVIVSKWILGEQVSAWRWIGVGLISIGIVAVSATPLRTKPPVHGEE